MTEYQCQHQDVAKGKCLECGLDVRFGMVIYPGALPKPIDVKVTMSDWMTTKENKKNE